MCTNVCKLATCGDGFKQPGEQCDAGDNNSNTGGLCTLACLLPKCGDQFVQPSKGEECDDGNASNGDPCLDTCKDAKCGDGFVLQGVEQCDDANASNNDLCTNTCKLAACNDSFKNGNETDVDCGGGTCQKCALTLQCLGGPDCQSGFCSTGKCALPRAARRSSSPTRAPERRLQLDADGVGPVPRSTPSAT
jgi:cysteine-rich repeat protein